MTPISRRQLFRIAGLGAMAAALPKTLSTVAPRSTVLFVSPDRWRHCAKAAKDVATAGSWRGFASLCFANISIVADRYIPKDAWAEFDAETETLIRLGAFTGA
jgi:hypothetical protein